MLNYTQSLTKYICITFFILVSIESYAFDNQLNKITLPDSFKYDYVDEQASFPGGINELKRFISENIHLPETAIQNNIAGKVILRLTISSKGEIVNIEVQKSIDNCKECEEEAIRIVKSMPNWNPAKVGNSTVKSTAVVPVNFVRRE